MISPTFYNQDPEQMSDVILELLNLTHGMEFAVLSSQHTADIQNQLKRSSTGMMRRSTSTKDSKISHNHARLRAYTQKQFLTDEAVKSIIFNAFFSGQLGIKDEQKRYAFNKERSNEFKEAGIKGIIVTNTPQGEQVDQDATLDMISDEVYQVLLQMLDRLNKKDSGNSHKESKDSHFQKHPNLELKKVAPSKKELRAPATTLLHTKRHLSEEIITENIRSEDRKRIKNAEKKDQLASEKRKKHISSKHLKEEIKNSVHLQTLIKNGEIDESTMFKLLQIAEIDGALFLQLLKNTKINKEEFVKKINQLSKELHDKLIT